MVRGGGSRRKCKQSASFAADLRGEQLIWWTSDTAAPATDRVQPHGARTNTSTRVQRDWAISGWSCIRGSPPAIRGYGPSAVAACTRATCLRTAASSWACRSRVYDFPAQSACCACSPTGLCTTESCALAVLTAEPSSAHSPSACYSPSDIPFCSSYSSGTIRLWRSS